jgi:hypothetical protein
MRYSRQIPVLNVIQPGQHQKHSAKSPGVKKSRKIIPNDSRGRAGQGRAGQGTAWHDRARHGMAGHGMTGQGTAGQGRGAPI